jgi:hypothetical protein
VNNFLVLGIEEHDLTRMPIMPFLRSQRTNEGYSMPSHSVFFSVYNFSHLNLIYLPPGSDTFDLTCMPFMPFCFHKEPTKVTTYLIFTVSPFQSTSKRTHSEKGTFQKNTSRSDQITKKVHSIFIEFHFVHIPKRAHSKKRTIRKKKHSKKSTSHFDHIPKRSHSKKKSIKLFAQSDLQPHYDNGVFGNVYLLGNTKKL